MEQPKIDKKLVFLYVLFITGFVITTIVLTHIREEKYTFVAKQYCLEKGKIFFDLEHKADCSGFSCTKNSVLNYYCFSKNDIKLISNSTAWDDKYGEDWDE